MGMYGFRGAAALAAVALLVGCNGGNTDEVSAAKAVAVAVVPGQASLAAGTMLQLHATLVNSDGTTQDVTSTAGWTSSNAEVLTVSSKGVLTAVAEGSATVRALASGALGRVFVKVSDATLKDIQVTGPSSGLALGTTEQLTATGTFSDGTTQDLTDQVSWASSDDTIATVDSSGELGLVTAVARGSVNVTATVASLGKSGSMGLVVTSATLQSLEVSPASPSLHLGNRQQLTATGHFSDGTTQDLTRQVTWASDAATVASIDDAGLVTSLTAGTANITATFGSVSGKASLTVDDAVLVSLSVTVPTSTAPRGTTLQLTATGTYSDGTTADLTRSVGWASSDIDVATVSTLTPDWGLASAKNLGAATLTATDAASGVSGSASFTVTAPALVSIEVAASSTTFAKGTSEPLTATGLYTDGTTQDLTSSVAWSSNDAAVVSVSTASGSKGVATAAALGTTTVIATGPANVQGSVDLTVSAATLVSIAVDPPSPSIAKGTQQSFTATGTFSDGTTQDLTSSATWSSSDTSVASVSNDAGTQEQVTGASAGAASITATAGQVSGSASLNVTSAVLTGLAVTPSSASVAKGLTRQLVATGTFSDGTNQDVTSLVAWSSSDSTRASVSNADGRHGLVEALAAGSVTVTAALDGQTSQASLTVDAAALTSIALSGGNSLPKGTTSQLTATGIYSDGTTAVVTDAVTWSSADTGIATVSNTSGSQGLVSAAGPGSVKITAQQGSVGASMSVTVTDASLVSIALGPASPTLAKGTTGQLVATGSYSDGTTRDITSSVTFTSADASVVSVSNAAGSHGLLTALATGGPVTVDATDGQGHSGTASVTVSGASLVSIAVSPSRATVVGTGTQRYTATGTYTDGTTQDLTTQVTWSSDDTAIATISNAGGADVLAQGVAPGNADLTASKDGVTSDLASLTVVAKALSSIAISPSPAYLSSGSMQLTATGTYNDGTTADLTTQVSWFSDGTASYTVSNASGSQGVVTWVASGNANIYAVMGTVSGTAAVSPCPAGFYEVGTRCAYDYYVDASGLVDQPNPCDNGAYYTYTTDAPDYGIQWQDAAPAGFTPSQITASFSVGVVCDAATQTYGLNGTSAGSITVQSDCACDPYEQQKTLDLSAVSGSYTVGGSNVLKIDAPFSYTSIDYGLMPDSAIGGKYGKVTVVY